MKKCKEIYDNFFIELYLSDELDSDKKNEFEKHINECDNCRNFLETEQSILDSMKFNEENLTTPPIELDNKILDIIAKDNNSIKTDENKKNIFSLFSNQYYSGLAIAASILILIVFTMSNNSDIENIYNTNGNNISVNINNIDFDLELENYFSLEEDIKFYASNELDSLEKNNYKQDVAFGYITDTEEEIDYYNYDDLNYYSEDDNNSESDEFEQELEEMYNYFGV